MLSGQGPAVRVTPLALGTLHCPRPRCLSQGFPRRKTGPRGLASHTDKTHPGCTPRARNRPRPPAVPRHTAAETSQPRLGTQPHTQIHPSHSHTGHVPPTHPAVTHRWTERVDIETHTLTHPRTQAHTQGYTTATHHARSHTDMQTPGHTQANTHVDTGTHAGAHAGLTSVHNHTLTWTPRRTQGLTRLLCTWQTGTPVLRPRALTEGPLEAAPRRDSDTGGGSQSECLQEGAVEGWGGVEGTQSHEPLPAQSPHHSRHRRTRGSAQQPSAPPPPRPAGTPSYTPTPHTPRSAHTPRGHPLPRGGRGGRGGARTRAAPRRLPEPHRTS